MATRDNYSGQAFVQALDPDTRDHNDSSVEGDTIDTQGFDSVMLVALVGETGDTLSGSIRIEFEVEHAEDDGDGDPDTWEAVPDADLLNYVDGAADSGTFAVLDANGETEQAYATGYRGDRRFVRVVERHAGTHANGTDTAAVAILGHAHLTPVNDVTT